MKRVKANSDFSKLLESYGKVLKYTSEATKDMGVKLKGIILYKNISIKGITTRFRNNTIIIADINKLFVDFEITYIEIINKEDIGTITVNIIPLQ